LGLKYLLSKNIAIAPAAINKSEYHPNSKSSKKYTIADAGTTNTIKNNLNIDMYIL
jgi:hypothetical protein